MIGWIGVAFAQDQAVWDFDTAFPDYEVLGGGVDIGAPTVPWAGDALILEMYPDSPPDVDAFVEMAGEGDGTFVVTHDTLHFQARTRSSWWTTVMAYVYVSDIHWQSDAGFELYSDWQPMAFPSLSPMCGYSAGLDLWATSWLDGDDVLELDDFVMTGTVCPQFADTDGDGLCPQGTDLDADGTCVAAGERLPVGEIADCDDTAFGPTCLTLVATPLVIGGTVTFTASGAEPGETVQIAGSATVGRRCPPVLGGACLSFGRPRLLGGAIADASGVAVVVVNVAVTALSPVWAQAGVVRPGAVANLSPRLEVTP